MKKFFLFIAAALCCAVMTSATEGALPGEFSVSATQKVVFSQGNLQAVCNADHTWTWRFAVNQWDCAGKENQNNTLINPTSSGYPGATYDLFGWSTAQTYYGLNISTSNSDYSGEFVDWGNLMGNGWRTLTYDEWDYLWRKRPNATALRGKARLGDAVSDYVPGYILLPDGADYNALGFDCGAEHWSDNTLNSNSPVLQAGAVFLPAAGYRDAIIVNEEPIGMGVYQVSNTCFYWSSSPYGETKASGMFGSAAQANIEINRYMGLSVRLVRDVWAEGIDNVDSRESKGASEHSGTSRKKIENGVLLIERGGKTYTTDGRQVR